MAGVRLDGQLGAVAIGLGLLLGIVIGRYEGLEIGKKRLDTLQLFRAAPQLRDDGIVIVAHLVDLRLGCLGIVLLGCSKDTL